MTILIILQSLKCRTAFIKQLCCSDQSAFNTRSKIHSMCEISADICGCCGWHLSYYQLNLMWTLCREIFFPSENFPIIWIPIEMAGFCLQRLIQQRSMWMHLYKRWKLFSCCLLSTHLSFQQWFEKCLYEYDI